MTEVPAATVSREHADCALGLRLADVPAEIVAKAKIHLLDTLGIGLASTGFEFAGPVLAGARLLGEGSRARAIGSGAAPPPAGAALVKGTLFMASIFTILTSARSTMPALRHSPPRSRPAKRRRRAARRC